MKFCLPHWNQLKDAIKARGLGDMIAASGEEAVKMLTSPQDKIENFEPLMTAHNILVHNALNAGGMYLLGQKEDGTDYCPICEAEEHGATGWIEQAADMVAERARELKPKTNN